MRYIGDIHGRIGSYYRIIEECDTSIQVGDFGIGFISDAVAPRIEKQFKNKHRFIRGNHDNPALCAQYANWIKDGTVENDTMYLGGAWSIDHQWRTAGVDWWPEEELSHLELEAMISLYQRVKPRVMITHDCPSSVSLELFIKKNRSLAGAVQYKTRTGEALQTMFELHQPELWIFGHWHFSVDAKINSTRFICLDELNYIDLEDGTIYDYRIQKGTG